MTSLHPVPDAATLRVSVNCGTSIVGQFGQCLTPEQFDNPGETQKRIIRWSPLCHVSGFHRSSYQNTGKTVLKNQMAASCITKARYWKLPVAQAHGSVAQGAYRNIWQPSKASDGTMGDFAGRLIEELGLVSCQQPLIGINAVALKHIAIPITLEPQFAVTEP
ncbi:hypothetical protein FQR65_LT20927 [Abscondita terminalis]|nr:hypothetical protein FQR65_LT20927 [Abscondita terminalis]